MRIRDSIFMHRRMVSRRRRVLNVHRKRINGDWCVYCGDLATTDEHFPPVCVTNQGVILPACRECNIIASTQWASDFEERCRYVRDRLREKYARVLRTPDWSSDEIEPLGYNLKTGVSRWQALRDSLKPRLAWDVIAYLACVDRDDVLGTTLARLARRAREEEAGA